MSVNIGVEVLVGSVPLLGDAFDVAWKANRRNFKLLARHMEQPKVHPWKDWAFLATLAAGLFAVFAAADCAHMDRGQTAGIPRGV